MLLRHAKSAWPEGLPDKERPLAERGLKAAPLMGDYMARQGLLPDLALVSTARRTQETWALLRSRLPKPVTARDCAEIYETSAADILELVASVDPACRNLLVVGHNPALQELALVLTRSSNSHARDKLAEKYPTAALAVLDFEMTDWDGLAPATGQLERFVTPRSLD